MIIFTVNDIFLTNIEQYLLFIYIYIYHICIYKNIHKYACVIYMYKYRYCTG